MRIPHKNPNLPQKAGMFILEVNQIQKRYGRIHALKGVSFRVPPGSVFGILGPNGSGKTTLLGILCDILRADGGSYTLFGQPPGAEQRRNIGTFLETPNFYHYLSAEQNLRIAAAIKQRGENDFGRVLQLVDLEARKNHRFSTYSLGMKQRLAIGSCLLGDPQVLILDEPTNGLDPEGIADTRELIRKMHAQGKTIIMASHLLDEVEKVCTHVAILKKGELLAAGEVGEILSNEDLVELGADNAQELFSAAQSIEGTLQVKQSGNYLEISFPAGKADAAAINRHFFSHQVVLTHLQMKKKSLESKFFELTHE
jgi:ABC-2 type transport system ATP-binding protein